jgi:hypothetical protein
MYDDAITLEELLAQQKSFNIRSVVITVLLIATLSGGLLQDSQLLFISFVLFCFSVYLFVKRRSRDEKIDEIE